MSTDTHAQPTASPDPVRVETEHVTVEKTPDSYAEDVVKIAFVVESAAAEPVELRLVDPLPAAISPDAVGFHPRFDPEKWHLDDGAVVYEDRLEPGETREPFYGVRVAPGDELAALRTAPEVEVTPLEPTEAGADPDEPSVEPADGEPSDGAGVEEAPDDGEPAAESDQTTATESSAADAETDGDADGDSSVEEPDEGRPPTGPLATDGEGSAVSGTPPEPARTVDDTPFVPAADNEALARLRHVQSRVDDLVAYSEALETFVAEHGEASAVVTSLQTGLDDLQATVEDLRSTVQDADARLSAAEGWLDEFDRRLDLVASLEARVDEQGDRLEALDDRVASAAADDAVRALDDRLAALEAAHETRMTTLADDLADLRATVERVDRWRAKLSEAAAQAPDEA